MNERQDPSAAPAAPPAAENSPPPTRDAFRHFLTIGTRWMDNDVYGHVNNVVYYSYFDTVVNQFLIERGVLDIHGGGVIGLVVETSCRYFSSVSFPDVVHAGLRVTRIGRSSVHYEIGLFANEQPRAAAQGRFVHVYVDHETRRPTELPAPLRAVLQTLQV